MPTPELLIVIQGLLATLCGVLWYMFLDVKRKADKNSDDLQAYKTYIAQTYVSQPQLTTAIDALLQNIQAVLTTVNKIEDRLYKKEQG